MCSRVIVNHLHKNNNCEEIYMANNIAHQKIVMFICQTIFYDKIQDLYSICLVTTTTNIFILSRTDNY